MPAASQPTYEDRFNARRKLEKKKGFLNAVAVTERKAPSFNGEGSGNQKIEEPVEPAGGVVLERVFKSNTFVWSKDAGRAPKASIAMAAVERTNITNLRNTMCTAGARQKTRPEQHGNNTYRVG